MTTRTRIDTRFFSQGEACAAWLYLPDAARPPPVIVMAHGVCGVRGMRLDAYAERFQAAGYACLVFDYRHFGDSDGSPRQLLDIGKQQQDWSAAIAHARQLPQVDATRVVVWGTSLSGGHALHLGATQPGLAAIIAQSPFTDGIASALATHPLTVLRITPLALVDQLRGWLGASPVIIPAGAQPRGTALMTAADCLDGYNALAAPGFHNQVAARIALWIPWYRPGRLAKKIGCPAFFAICNNDSVAPARRALAQLRLAPRGELHRYDAGHFEIYLGEPFEQVVTDQIDFLQRQVPLP